MTTSTSRLAYDHIFEVMERAFDLEPPKVLRIPFNKQETIWENRGAAMQFRTQLHSARVIDRKDNKELYVPEHPLYGRSKYDILEASIRTVEGTVFLYLIRRSLKHLTIEEVDDLPVKQVEYEEQKLIESPEKIAKIKRRF